ncbi:hypothetical protein ACFW04_013320 [Cataglyphis niger]
MPSSKTRIAIIGMTGLVVARHMVIRLNTYNLMLFEQSDHIGGTWVTNIPKKIMQIPDFPFQNQEGPSFVHHSVIREYLLDYAKQFNLYPDIKLNTLTLWTVTYKDLESKVETTKTFDAVVLCNGHYTVGHIPHIPGIESFHGGCIHSHQYRMPDTLAKRFAYSAHLQRRAKTNIESVQGNVFFFRDGSSAEVDSFIYCTGYKFTYPFMSTKVEIRTDDNHVEPIYKLLVHMDYTNPFFMGLPAIMILFPMFHIQAKYILKVLEGRIQLPSSQRMREEYEIEKKSLLDQGIQLRHINKLKDRQWAYDEIAAAANVPSFPPVIRKIFDHVIDMRDINFTTYKNYQYRINNNENFNVSYCKPC